MAIFQIKILIGELVCRGRAFQLSVGRSQMNFHPGTVDADSTSSSSTFTSSTFPLESFLGPSWA
eukprot:3714492-Pyramimonas_sp.AAC.1